MTITPIRAVIASLLFSCVLISVGVAKEDVPLYDGTQKLSGAKTVPDPTQGENAVYHWHNAAKGHRAALLSKPISLSDQQALSFRFYSDNADNHSVWVICESNNPDDANSNGNYYHKKFKVDWVGWKTIVMPFDGFLQTRKPHGWKHIGQIYFANSGYGGMKANPTANYLIDDMVALKDKPAPAVLRKNESAQLDANDPSMDFQFDIDPTDEFIYGIRYELQGEPGAKARLRRYKTWDAQRNVRDVTDFMGSKWQPQGTTKWETKHVEILVKKGSARLEFTMALIGEKPIKVRNVRVIKGGFPDNPPLPEAPYLDWIRSLKPNMTIAKQSSLLEFAKGGSKIWNHRGGRTVYLDDEDEVTVRQELAPYMKLSVGEILELMPTQRPFQFNSGCWGLRYAWTPDKPNEIRNTKTGALFEPTKVFPVHGTQTVTAPSGKQVNYAYHDYDKNDEKYKGQRVYAETFYKGSRIYVERFMNDARYNAFSRAGTHMTLMYHKTGDEAYAIRAAAIIWAMARNMPDWPVHGKPSWNTERKLIRLQDGDYYSWFSFVMGGDWYVTEGNVLWLARYFDLIRDAPVWDKVATEAKVDIDALNETSNGLLHIAKMSLKRDAFYRTSPFVIFHNLSGTEHRNYITLARALGVPELIHYSLRKIRGTFDKVFMADGVFPESQWYTLDQYGRQSQAMDYLRDYRDPPGFTSSFDGSRLDITDPTESIPSYKRIKEALERQTYPDGSAHTVHDSWSHTANPPKSYSIKFKPREETDSYLFRSFGHGVLGRGKRPHRIEAQLHFSGAYNHGHQDLMNLNFWAYGDELLSDIGYSHITSYNSASASHNLVMVNGGGQKRGDNGSLESWFGRPGSVQIVQSSQGSTPAYPECSIYRRGLVLLPFGDDRNAVLDIFEVQGGDLHDWMANGCADYEQVVTTTLTPTETKDNLASDGVAIENSYPWGDTTHTKYIGDKYGDISKWWGAFRNAKLSPIKEPWTLTMSPTAPVAADTRWAGARAKSSVKKPSMKLHWLHPMDGTAIVAEAPRNRYHQELHRKPEARKAWSSLRMPKTIVRREGKDLKSTFVALWEPHYKTPFVANVKPLKGLNSGALGWNVSDDETQTTVVYQPAENVSEQHTALMSSKGRFVVSSTTGNSHALQIQDGTHASDAKVALSLTSATPAKVVTFNTVDGQTTLRVQGDVLGGTHTERRFVDEYVCFDQAGATKRWFKVKHITTNKTHSDVVLAQDPGFAFDVATGVLTETYFPYRVSTGTAYLALASWGTLRIASSETAITGSMRVSADAKATLKGLAAEPAAVMVRYPGSNDGWQAASSVYADGTLTISVTPRVISDEWIEFKITNP